MVCPLDGPRGKLEHCTAGLAPQAAQLAANMYHGPRCGNEVLLADVVAGFLAVDHASNELDQLIVRRTAPYQPIKIVIPHGEKTGANLAVGGDTNTAAVSTERMGDRRDNPDLPDAIVENIATCGLAVRMRNFNHRSIL